MRQSVIFLLLLLCLSAPMSAQQFREQQLSTRYVDAHGDTVTLAVTFTYPKGARRHSCPAMILVTGSGLQNRDEELLGHSPFKVIAEQMAAQGIAVLRYDDRGVGESTCPDVTQCTTLDFADDAEACFRLLRRQRVVDPSRVGILGHSEGGLIAPIVASRNADVAFVVMLAGPGLNGAEGLLLQNEQIFRLKGVPDSLIAVRLQCMRLFFAATDSIVSGDTAQLTKRLNIAYRSIKDANTRHLSKEQKQRIGMTTAECYGWAATMANPWMRTFCKLDPADYLPQVKCPLLALNGDKDCQVPAGPNLAAVERLCSQASTLQIIPFSGLNHLFQECTTGAVEEYAQLGQSPAPQVLAAIAAFIHSLAPSKDHAKSKR